MWCHTAVLSLLRVNKVMTGHNVPVQLQCDSDACWSDVSLWHRPPNPQRDSPQRIPQSWDFHQPQPECWTHPCYGSLLWLAAIRHDKHLNSTGEHTKQQVTYQCQGLKGVWTLVVFLDLLQASAQYSTTTTSFHSLFHHPDTWCCTVKTSGGIIKHIKKLRGSRCE